MCDCIKKTEKAILERMKEENKDKAIITEGTFNHMGLSFTGNAGWRTYQEFEYDFTPIKKNGEEGRKIKKKVSMYHTYCPFCGKPYPK